MYSKILALILLPLIASAAFTNPLKVATRPNTDGWRRGGGCVMKDDLVAIMLSVKPNAGAGRTNAAIWSLALNKDGTSRGEAYSQINTANVDDILDNAAITCLGTGGSAFLHQISSSVTVTFFNNKGQKTNSFEKMAYREKSCMAPTSEGGFVITDIDNSGANSAEVYNADGTKKSTINLATYTDYQTFAQRGKDGTVIIILVKTGTMILKFFNLDGTSAGNDINLSVSGNPGNPTTATLADGKLVVMNPSKDTKSFAYSLYNSDLSLFKDYGTKTNAMFEHYNLAALTDGGWVYSWWQDQTRNGYYQIMNADGSTRTEPQLVDVKSGPFVVAYNDGSIFNIWYDETSTDQFLWAVRLDPKGNQIGFGAACDNCPSQSTKSFFTGTFRYNIPFDQFVSSNGEAKFIQALMSVLNVKIEQITIISITSGSTVVDFKITEDKSNTKAGSISNIKSSLDTAAKNGQVTVLNAQVLGYTSNDVVVAGVSKLQVAFGALIVALLALMY